MSNAQIELKAKYKNDFDKLFQNADPKFEQLELGYALPETIKKNAVLFIGLNPSYGASSKPGSHFYPLGEDPRGFYGKFQGIAGEYPWDYLDLLAIRETHQNNVEALEKTNLQFIWDNLQISKEILENSQPKAIVVVNTLARKYLGKDKAFIKKKCNDEAYNVWLGYDFGEILEDGTFRITKSDKLKDVPVFFSGMLTGQRAIDNGSYERLKWHVQKVLTEMK